MNKKIEELGKPKLVKNAVSPLGRTIQKPFNLTTDNRGERLKQIRDGEKRETPANKMSFSPKPKRTLKKSSSLAKKL